MKFRCSEGFQIRGQRRHAKPWKIEHDSPAIRKKAGKTAEQAAAEFKAPEKYKGYSSTMGALMGGLPGYIQRVYDGI